MKNLAGSPRRDELSDVLQAVRFRRAIFCRSELTAPWGFSVLGRDFATFHLVTRGKCCLDVDGVGRRAMFSVASGGRRGGLYPLSAGEPGLTFRVADRGTVTVKGTTLTWTPTGGRASHAARLHPLTEP